MENLRVCFTGPLEVALVSEPVAEQPEPDQLRVRSIFSLISPGTELALYTQTHVGFKDPGNLWAKYPHYPGYAAVGSVEAVGGAIQDFRPGDVVFYFGRHQLYTLLSAKEDIILPVPDNLPLEVIPFARMIQIAQTAVLVSSGASGRRVAVLGLGMIGNFAAQLFQLQGAEVWGIDLLPARREWARQCGLAGTIGADGADPIAAIKEVTGGQGVDIVVEATGDPTLVNPALQMAGALGEVILLGSPRGKAEVDVYDLIHRTGVSLKGAHERLFSKLADRRISLRQIMQHLEAGRLIVEPLISHKASPREIGASYQALLHQKETTIGVLVDWSQV